VLAVSGISNRSQRSVYNYARRPILRTGLRPVQLFLVDVGFDTSNMTIPQLVSDHHTGYRYNVLMLLNIKCRPVRSQGSRWFRSNPLPLVASRLMITVSKQGRSDGGVHQYIYPPKIRPSKLFMK